MNTQKLKQSSFAGPVIGVGRPVLVDFWAEWCVACRAIAPALVEISREYEDQLTLVKLNVDEDPDALALYNVRSIPTLILFKRGQPAARTVGAISLSALRQWLDGNL